MSEAPGFREAQRHINGLTVSMIIREAQYTFRDDYPGHVFALGVGPIQSMLGLAVMNGHIAVPNVWQPIETAPKDGTEILAFHRDGQSVAFWDLNMWMEANGEYRVTPTHWQPLPAPPCLG